MADDKTTRTETGLGPALDAIIVVLCFLVVYCLYVRMCRASRPAKQGFTNFVESSFDEAGAGRHNWQPMFGGYPGPTGSEENDDPGISTLRQYSQAGTDCSYACHTGASSEMPRLADSKSGGACYNSLRMHQEPFLDESDGLYPETGAEIGPLTYHHYDGLPPNWTLPVLPKTSSGCGRGRPPVPGIEDVPSLDHQMRAAMAEAEYPSHYDALPIKLQGPQSREYYGALTDPDHEPMMGTTSYVKDQASVWD